MAETYYAHRAQISMAEETTPGTTVSAPAHYPFHCTSFDLPDEAIDWKTIKAIGAGRDWNSIAEGPHSFEGSVDATLIKGDILFYAMGKETDTASVSATGQTTCYAAAAGATTLILADAVGVTADIYIQVGDTGYREIRKISALATTTATLDKAIRYAITSGSTVSRMTGTTYVHTLSVGNTLKSFTLEYGQDGTTDIRRKFNGCYINTCEFGCEEEGMLNANFGLMAMNTSTADTSISTVTIPTTAPYMFDEGVITLFGGTVATVKSFKVNVNNNLKALRYIQSTNGRNVYEVAPGNRTIEITVTAVPQAATWTNLMRPEQQTGTTFTAKFSRSASDYLQVSCTSAFMKECKQSIPEEGEIVAEMTFVAKTCTVTTSDTTPYYWMA